MQSADSVQQQGGGEHRDVSANQQQLHDIVSSVHTSTTSKIGRDLSMQDRNPAQGQPQDFAFPVGADQGFGDDLQRIQIDVRLIEAVEEHQSIYTYFVQLVSHMRDIAIVRTQLDRQRDADRFAHLAHQVQHGFFDTRPGQPLVGGQVVHVELQRVGSRLLDQARVLDPPSS